MQVSALERELQPLRELLSEQQGFMQARQSQLEQQVSLPALESMMQKFLMRLILGFHLQQKPFNLFTTSCTHAFNLSLH